MSNPILSSGITYNSKTQIFVLNNFTNPYLKEINLKFNKGRVESLGDLILAFQHAILILSANQETQLIELKKVIEGLK